MHLPGIPLQFSHQRGQASVFVLALLGVVIVCAVFLYQSGRITSEKMQLQNAADAAAFGNSVLEARSLNFSAYTNRAMVANEVAVGQLVGMLSWADELTTSAEYAESYSLLLEGIAALTLLVPGAGEGIEALFNALILIIETVGDTLTLAGEALDKVFDVIVPPAIRGISLINQSYSASQKIYHGATYVLGVKNLYQSLEDNVVGAQFSRSDMFKKDLSGPQLSDLGIIALAGHLPSFWSGYTRIYSSEPVATPKKPKKKGNKKDDKKGDKKDDKKDDKKKNNDGMGRLAATIRESRDAFSSGKPKWENRSWSLELGFDKHVRVKILKIFKLSLGLQAALGGESQGGSELRKKNNSFVWTGADSLVFGGRGYLWGSIKAGPLKGKYSMHLPLPELPFGSGGVQAPGTATDMLLPTDILPSYPQVFYGHRDMEVYAGAGSFSHLLAWPDVVAEMELDPLETYQGLQSYRDMSQLEADKAQRFSPPFQAPYVLVGYTWPLNDITSKGPQFSGRFDLVEYDNKTNVDRLGVIAKSELYFSRPAKVSYFLRSDKKRENPNVFSPFWQARLVDTSNSDRFLALAIQQKILWLSEEEKGLVGGSVLNTIFTAVDEILDTVASVLDRILRLFL